mmetsp:Transcript_14611/g.26292  ORF Transcript_14611/g.26292 Transcript_14611/m.26292 type:complete len:100 (-) Transcript_14611:191-490(-)
MTFIETEIKWIVEVVVEVNVVVVVFDWLLFFIVKFNPNSPQSPLGEQKEYDASGKKKEEKNNKDDKNKDDTSGSGMLDGIPTTEYYKKKKGPLKRHGTC